MGYTLLLGSCIRTVDVINLCRNTSDGMRPLIPPCSLASSYTFTNMLYLDRDVLMTGASTLTVTIGSFSLP